MQTSDMIELMRHMRLNGIRLFEYEADNQRLRLEKTSADPGQLADDLPEADPGPAKEPVVQDHVIKSPVVGVFYAAPAPGSDPFVKEGSKIDAGETVCIIEAMKLMNEVTSSIGGEIRQIFVEDGQRVEYGQPLMSIKGADNDTEAG